MECEKCGMTNTVSKVLSVDYKLFKVFPLRFRLKVVYCIACGHADIDIDRT